MPSECFMSSCKAFPFFTSLCSPAFPCLQVLYSSVIVMVKENMNWLFYKKSALEYIKLKVPLVSAHSNSSFTLGFAFVYFVDERDARDAIRYLDNTLFGHSRRRLSVEWAKVIVLLYILIIIKKKLFCFFAFEFLHLICHIFSREGVVLAFVKGQGLWLTTGLLRRYLSLTLTPLIQGFEILKGILNHLEKFYM